MVTDLSGAEFRLLSPGVYYIIDGPTIDNLMERLGQQDGVAQRNQNTVYAEVFAQYNDIDVVLIFHVNNDLDISRIAFYIDSLVTHSIDFIAVFSYLKSIGIVMDFPQLLFDLTNRILEAGRALKSGLSVRAVSSIEHVFFEYTAQN